MNRTELRKKVVADLRKQQGHLKARLHEGIRQYLKYRHARAAGVKLLATVKIKDLVKLQRDVNRVRKTLNQTPIKYVQEMRKVLKFY